MTLRHMRIFVAVCETQSVTKAAEKLYISQPSVSQAIIDLEEHFGTRLFDRISRRLYITDAGKQLYEYMSHILTLYKEMEDRMQNWERSGSVRIGSSITIGNRMIPALVAKAKQTFPDLQIYVAISNSEDIEQKVLRGELDFALIEGLVHSGQIVSQKIMDDRLTLICGREHPLAGRKSVRAAELADYDFLGREKGSGTREIVDSSLLVHGVLLQPIWESISTQALINAVANGLGISILPYRLAEPEIRAGSIVSLPIEEISFERTFYLIYSANKYLSATAREIMEMTYTLDQTNEQEEEPV
jgi:DNA-binding transcriptional LysR family regulator